jgi:hypothetical protein
MAVDTTFQPKTPTYAVDGSGAVTIDGRQDGVSSWRIRSVVATPVAGSSAYIKWAPPPPSAAPSAAVAPTLGNPVPNEIGVNCGQTVYLEGIGAWLQFIGTSGFVIGTNSFEVTGGQGGCGG